MIQKFILMGVSLGFFQLARCQSITPQVLANAGKYLSTGGSSVEFTVGELVVSTLNASGNMVTQGFHQTYTATSSLDENEIAVTIHVYPNPAVDWLTITVEAVNKPEFIATIHDGFGRKVLDQSASNQSKLQLNVSTLAAGTYYITLLNGTNHIPIKTIQIQKLSNQ